VPPEKHRQRDHDDQRGDYDGYGRVVLHLANMRRRQADSSQSRCLIRILSYRGRFTLGDGPAVFLPTGNRMLGRGAKDKEHAMSQKLESAIRPSHRRGLQERGPTRY
jgi:hypothetical protein